MTRRSTFLALVGFAWLASTFANARAAPLVELRSWDGRATFVRNRGAGPDVFRLVADANWDQNAPKGLARYLLRVALPQGQVSMQGLGPDEGPPGSARISVVVPAAAVRNLRPEAVVVRTTVVDVSTGKVVSNELAAGIDQFPASRSPGAQEEAESGPVGWGQPIAAPDDQAVALPRPGPDGLSFVRVPPTQEVPGFFIATTEATNGQVGRRLEGYDPRAGRSDEFALEAPDQPAVGLTPKKAQDYLGALGEGDSSGLTYRLPTRAEWLRAARAGETTAFWWGDEPKHPEGANFLGPEPALQDDTTAPAAPASAEATTFQANPWGLAHTFGNVAEWAEAPSGGFVRLGGHFRTEPANPLPEVAESDAAKVGPDPYVGLRPAFDLTAESGASLVRKALGAEPKLAGVQVAFDPDRATATLNGDVADRAARRQADNLLRPLWFLAAVENRLNVPTVAPGKLARLGARSGNARRIMPLGRRVDEIPIAVQWGDRLPVEGSEWWVNIFAAGHETTAHVMIERRPGSPIVTVLLDRRLVPVGVGVSAALSLGAPVPTPNDPRIVTNVVPVPNVVPEVRTTASR